MEPGQERYRETKRQRYLDPDELAAVASSLDRLERAGAIQLSSAAAIRLILATGARRSEIRRLRWEDVDGHDSPVFRV